MIDFAQYDTSSIAEEGSWMEVEFNGEKIGARIKLNGTDSKSFRDLVRARAREQMARRNKSPDLSQAEDQAVKTLARCTLDWEGVGENGNMLDCTFENVCHIYGKYLWLREQVDIFMADRANFLPDAAKVGSGE